MNLVPFGILGLTELAAESAELGALLVPPGLVPESPVLAPDEEDLELLAEPEPACCFPFEEDDTEVPGLMIPMETPAEVEGVVLEVDPC